MFLFVVTVSIDRNRKKDKKMIPEFEKIEKLAHKGNMIPIYEEMLSDMETPVSVFTRFSNDEHAFLLESVEGGKVWGRYSIIGINPHSIFFVKNGKAFLKTPSGEEKLENPEKGFMALRDYMKQFNPVKIDGLPIFTGGAAGFMNYETVNEFEPKLLRIKEASEKNKINEVSACFMICDNFIVFDNVKHTMKIVSYARLDDAPSLKQAYNSACERITMMKQRLSQALPFEHYMQNSDSHKDVNLDIKSNFTREEYENIVLQAKDYITQGELIQVVLSQSFTTKVKVDAISIYRALRLVNPSPYTFMFKFQDKTLIGASPEVMVRLIDDKAVVRPIAGTRPRGVTEQEDRKLADELLKDPKEKAEHLMLVDLGRNDLGKIAIPASVKVPDYMIVEKYSHVQHLVSTVTAQLAPETDAFDLMAACFPAGTLSGAPKFRAMEIISQLEKDARGFYGGSAGYIGFDGNADMAITIRTLLKDGDKITYQSGAGIVNDSIPEKEYDECLQKSGAMKRAIELAANGLNMNNINEGKV